jgi:hypothetical protein
MARKQASTTPAIKRLRNECYDILVATLNRNSKWYDSDCDDIWKNLLKKNEAELRETLSRQRAIANVSEVEMRRHCQFEGLI